MLVQKKLPMDIWIAVDRYGKRFLSFVCGDRSTKTGLVLWDNIKGINVNYFASDSWRSYEEFIPAGKHLQTKAETYTIEGYNSRIRHYLARFKRRGKCYSKAAFMIEVSLTLLMLKLNRGCLKTQRPKILSCNHCQRFVQDFVSPVRRRESVFHQPWQGC